MAAAANGLRRPHPNPAENLTAARNPEVGRAGMAGGESGGRASGDGWRFAGARNPEVGQASGVGGWGIRRSGERARLAVCGGAESGRRAGMGGCGGVESGRRAGGGSLR